MSDALVPVNRDSSVVARVISTGRRGFDYLGKNGDKSVGFMIKALAVLFGIGLAWYNIDAIHHFIETAVATETLILKGGVVAVGLWLLWLIISNKRLHYLVAQMVDQTVESLHMWWIDRDKFGSALYSIRRLKGMITVAEQAKGVVYGVIAKQDDAITQHGTARDQALQKAKGFQAELERRRTSPSGRSVSPAVEKLTLQQLESSFQLAKGQLHSHDEFYQSLCKDRAANDQRAKKIAIVIDAVTAQVGKFETDLQIAKEKWDFSQQNLIAAEAASTVISGPEFQDFQQALQGIKNEVSSFEGQVRRYMDQLDPTVKAYQTDQAASDIADDEFYRSFASDLGLNEGDVKMRLALPAASETRLSEIDEILGNTTVVREKQPVLRATPVGERKFTLFDRKPR